MAQKKKSTPKRKTSQAKAKTPAPKKARTTTLKPGTKIERTYKGKKVVVTVAEDGFRHGGKTYPSLTALAMHITGYKAVSGPRFFGFTEATQKKGG